MKIKFNLSYGDLLHLDLVDQGAVFEIHHIEWLQETDGRKYDISICATEDVLLKIGEMAIIGWNIKELTWEGACNSSELNALTMGVTHAALYAQLPPFELEDCRIIGDPYPGLA